MNGILVKRDMPIWLAAKPWLDVRLNDEHTLISYSLAKALLRVHPEAEERVLLPAILLHDIGWKMFPEELLAQAVGPAPKYPELQRAHEIESARIARIELQRLAISGVDIDRVIAIIDGHDTRPQPQSLEDALMKDADKLWRFTTHGIATLSVWFATPAKDTVAMLESFVLPKLTTETGRTMAQALLADGVAAAWMEDMLRLKCGSVS
ncbi:MAG: HD domain-containing protein [Beijerinckiaceae bacterium]